MLKNSMLSQNDLKKIIVFGAGGFIGRHLSLALDKLDPEIHLFNRSPLNDLNLQKAQFHQFDYPNDLKKYKDEITGADVAFFLINTHKQSEDNPTAIEDFKKQCEDFVDFCRKQNVKKIVFTSSASVYGVKRIVPITEASKCEPVSHYAQEKSVFEDVLLKNAHSLDTAILRITNPYGPLQAFKKGQGVIPLFIDAIENQELVPVYGKKFIDRDFIYIDDLIKAMLRAAYIPSEEKVFNIGSGQATKISTLIDLVEEVTGKTLRHKIEKQRPFDIPSNHVDISRAQSYLDWSPEVFLKDGLERTWGWFQSMKK